MIRTQISFDKALYDKARRVAKRRGVSLAELCRRSVAEAVSREESSHPWMSFVGVLDGDANDSSSVDHVVYGRDAP
ncbi:MAG: CopG family transcriptional regulator [Gammaproteobacteria bacterium]